MNILLDNVDFSSSSGPNSFGKKLANALVQKGHNLSVDPLTLNVDAILTFIMTNLKVKSSPMALRLDGIYFNTAQDYETLNAPIEMTYRISDAVIFQSRFNKLLTEHYFGEHENSHVIHNGADISAIDNIAPLRHKIIDKYDEVWSCASSWRPHKRLKDNVLYFLDHSPKNSCLVVAGASPDFVIDEPRVFYVGPIDWMTLASLYKRSEKFLHLAWLDHCPNVVVDARAAGCQIVCSSAGGTKEIAGKDAIVIAEDPWDLTPVKLYNPPKLDFTKTQKNDSKSAELDINLVTDKYVDILSGISNNEDSKG